MKTEIALPKKSPFLDYAKGASNKMNSKKVADTQEETKKPSNSRDIWNILTNFLFVFLLLLLILYVVRIFTDPTVYPDELLAAARIYRDNGQFHQSKQMYEEYLEEFGDKPDGYIEYAQLLLENGFFSESQNILNQLNESILNPRLRSEYHLLRGRIHERSGDFLAALRDYRAAYDLNEFNIMNGLMLITTNIRIPERTNAVMNEFTMVEAQLERLTSDPTVFSFIQACQAYEASDFLPAYELYKKSAYSEIPFIRYESFRQMMHLTAKIEADSSVIFSNMEEIIQMARNLDNTSRLLVHSLEEIYAVSIFEYVNNNEELSEQTRSELLNKSKDLLHSLFMSGVATPNVYLCYAAILRDEGDYSFASAVLKKAEQTVGDNILILIHQVYTEVGYQNNFGSRAFDNISELNDRIEELFSEEPSYKAEMMEYREFIRNMSRMGLL